MGVQFLIREAWHAATGAAGTCALVSCACVLGTPAFSLIALLAYALSACRIAGGLAWFAFLAVGSLGEQVKTRLEVSREAAGAQDVDTAPVTLPSGVVYQDVRVGGGSLPKKGDLVVLQYRCSILTLEHDVLCEVTQNPTALQKSCALGQFQQGFCCMCHALSTAAGHKPRGLSACPEAHDQALMLHFCALPTPQTDA